MSNVLEDTIFHMKEWKGLWDQEVFDFSSTRES